MALSEKYVFFICQVSQSLFTPKGWNNDDPQGGQLDAAKLNKSYCVHTFEANTDVLFQFSKPECSFSVAARLVGVQPANHDTRVTTVCYFHLCSYTVE